MPRQFSMRPLVVVLLIVLLFTPWALAVKWMFQPSEKSHLLPPGSAFPPLRVAGWINQPAPKSMEGEVSVVDVWAYWCGPCRAAMPELVATYEKFKDRNVRFLGLTSEGPESLNLTQDAVREARLPWPNGYGASATIDALGVEYIPTVFVVGRDGKVIWNSEARGSLEDAIKSALERKG